MNFARAFKVAGAKSVVSSLWSVDDKATSMLLDGFYNYLDEGHTKSEALHLAKLDYLGNADNETASPLYWSGLVLYGNDIPLLLNRKSNYCYWVGGVGGVMGVLLLGGVLLYRRKYHSLK
jgi:hypothetical protein